MGKEGKKGIENRRKKEEKIEKKNIISLCVGVCFLVHFFQCQCFYSQIIMKRKRKAETEEKKEEKNKRAQNTQADMKGKKTEKKKVRSKTLIDNYTERIL